MEKFIFFWAVKIFLFLFLIEASQALTAGPLNTLIESGQTLILNCSSDMVPGTHFVWYRIDVNTGARYSLKGCLPAIPPAPYRFIRGEKSCDLIVDSVTRAEALLYRCEPQGDQSTSAAVVVLDPVNALTIAATIEQEALNVNVIVNTRLSITCTLRYAGFMTPDIEWNTDWLTVLNKSRLEQPGELRETIYLYPGTPGDYDISCRAVLNPGNRTGVVIFDIPKQKDSASVNGVLTFDLPKQEDSAKVVENKDKKTDS